ncbi:alkaline phosphatase family protein [Parapedobacter soli]|uniref:alkaline phosphatase family protein n=1 Tax=Parapedobacter soli TaxID=416955 RepID=UPI0021C7BC74|nr:alkaline phosphatase family protein [Parapedobacter soli]
MRSNPFRMLGAIVLAFGFLSACQPGGADTAETPKAKKAIFVIVDGIPADVIERVNTPWIDSIAAEGGYTRAFTGGEAPESYSVSPTISAVCYAHLVTGVWTNKHNVWGNGLEAVNFNYPTAFWYVKNHYPEKTIAIYSTWEDNRTKLVGEGKPETGNLQFDFAKDGYESDTVAYPHNSEPHYIHRIDERVSEEAAQSIRQDAPDLSWVYLQYTDNAGHDWGDSPQMDSAVVNADIQVGRIWQAVKEREADHNEEWLVYIVTDHGRDDKGYHHGGQSQRERTIWFSTNDKNLNSYFHEGTPGLVDVLPSVLRFMEVDIPREYAFEMDGIPLSGEVSHQFTAATVEGDSLNLTWKPFKQSGNMSVWLTTTNNHKDGSKDEYVLLGEVALQDGAATFDVSAYSSDFYKVVLESTDHITNRWVTR